MSVMRNRLSSDTTYLTKLFLPALFGGSFLLFLVQTFRHSQAKVEYFPIIFLGIAALFACWLGLSLKHISVDENFLYVSNYRGEVKFPISNVIGVKEISKPVIRQMIFVYISEPSGFVRAVMFHPANASIFRYRASEAFLELRKIVRRNQEAN